MLKRIIDQRESKALLVLPYVALVQEKVRWLRQLVEGLTSPPTADKDQHAAFNARPSQDGLRVVGFFGGGKVRATWNDFDIGVCTLEKVGATEPWQVRRFQESSSIIRPTCLSMQPSKIAQ